MKPAPFTYVRPETVDEAVRFLSEHGDEAKPISGGQSLMPMMNLRLVYLDYLVDIGRLPDLDTVTAASDGGLELGGLVRHHQLLDDATVRERAPVLAEAAPLIGHPAVRRRGTVGGSLAHADPAAELPTAMLALDATIRTASTSGRREIPASEFFQSIFTTSLEPGEIVVGVRIPAPAPRTGWSVRELMRRHGDFAIVGVMAGLTAGENNRCEAARIVLFGVAETPYRAAEAEKSLRGESVTPEALAEAARLATASLEPPSDIHASGEYRKEAGRVYTERALTQAWERASG